MTTLLEKIRAKNNPIEKLPTGLLSLDLCLDNGLSRGKVTEIRSIAGLGKTSLALQICKTTTNNNGFVFYITLEDNIPYTVLDSRGIRKDNIAFCSIGDSITMVQVLKEIFTEEPNPDLLVIDSFASVVPENETIDSKYRYKLLRSTIREINSIAIESKTVVLVLNQERSRIGSSDQTVGGQSIIDWADTRISLSSVEIIHEDYINIGNKIKFEIENKFSSGKKICYANYLFSSGFDENLDILNLALYYNLIEMRGAYFYYKDENNIEWKLGKGKNKAKNNLNKVELIKSISSAFRLKS